MNNTRKYWIDTMLKIVHPVLDALSRDNLKVEMPVECKAERPRNDCTYLEALGRTLVGIAPWLEAKELSDEEESLRGKYAELSRKAIKVGVDPTSKDHLNFSEGLQPIVDAAFLAHAILRAPTELWDKLDTETQKNLISEMKKTRTRKPHANNWLLFSAMIEAFLFKVGDPNWDAMRIDYALRQHMAWYRGDSVYSDGADVHIDYYNSFVIQPMLVDILETVSEQYPEWRAMLPKANSAIKRYAAILEKIIAPDGTYPIVGRSVSYRFGAFQALAQATLQNKLPADLPAEQVRCALTAVIKKTMSFNNFDENGWLKIGICGSQPELGESYISTGSLYLCSAVFLPLGLSPNEQFWSGEDLNWTSVKIWSGNSNIKADHALTIK